MLSSKFWCRLRTVAVIWLNGAHISWKGRFKWVKPVLKVLFSQIHAHEVFDQIFININVNLIGATELILFIIIFCYDSLIKLYCMRISYIRLEIISLSYTLKFMIVRKKILDIRKHAHTYIMSWISEWHANWLFHFQRIKLSSDSHQ